MKKLFSNKGMDLTTGPLIPKIITYTIPIILTGVLQLMFNAADLIVVGQFAENGEEALAAVGGTGPLINLVINAYDDSITIDLHIMVDHGVNLNAVGEAIISEVRYVVTKCTGTEVRAVNVYIDSMMAD